MHGSPNRIVNETLAVMTKMVKMKHHGSIDGTRRMINLHRATKRCCDNNNNNNNNNNNWSMNHLHHHHHRHQELQRWTVPSNNNTRAIGFTTCRRFFGCGNGGAVKPRNSGPAAVPRNLSTMHQKTRRMLGSSSSSSSSKTMLMSNSIVRRIKIIMFRNNYYIQQLPVMMMNLKFKFLRIYKLSLLLSSRRGGLLIIGNISSFLLAIWSIFNTTTTTSDDDNNTIFFLVRYLAIVGTTLSILSQYYYRTVLLHVPVQQSLMTMMIPIRWNILLLIMNVNLTMKLYSEYYNANYNMSDELQILYKDAFCDDPERKGLLNRIEFYKLFHQFGGQKVQLSSGQYLIRNGQVTTTLYFLIKGKISIQQNDGIQIATVTPYRFIGDIAFLNYFLFKPINDTTSDGTVHPAIVNAIVIKEKEEEEEEEEDCCCAVVYKWNFAELKHHLRKERTIFNALSTYINHDLKKNPKIL